MAWLVPALRALQPPRQDTSPPLPRSRRESVTLDLRHCSPVRILCVHSVRVRCDRLAFLAEGSGPRRALSALAARPGWIQGGATEACEHKHTPRSANAEDAWPRANPEGRRGRGALRCCGSSPMHRSARIAFLTAPSPAHPDAGVALEILSGAGPQTPSARNAAHAHFVRMCDSSRTVVEVV